MRNCIVLLIVLAHILTLSECFTRHPYFSKTYSIRNDFNPKYNSISRNLTPKKTLSYKSVSKLLPIRGGFIAKALSVGLSTIASPVISGGVLAGGLHAVTGPDHLAALVPASIGKPGWYGGRIGAIWGVGHSISAMILGLSAFFLKGQMSGRFKMVKRLAYIAESAVGFSLIAIGLLGLKESMSMKDESDMETDIFDSSATTIKSTKAILINGMLHGFSLDGAPSVAPAIAMSSWGAAISFLLSYGVGVTLAMSLATGTIGEISLKIEEAANDPEVPKKLSLVSSVLAIGIGIYWVLQSSVFG